MTDGGPERRRSRRAPSRSALLALAAWFGLVGVAVSRGEILIVLCALFLAAGLLAWSRAPQDDRLAPPEGGDDREPDRDLIAAVPVPVIVVDGRAVVVSANGEARAAVPGLRPGHPLAFAVRAPDVLEAVREVLATGEPRDVEYGGRTPAERTFLVRLRLAPTRRRALPAGQGSTRGMAGGAAAIMLFHDLSAERRLETMRADFIATASHELRTPLASLSGFIDTLQGPARDDAAARTRFLAIMRSQATRMTRLVDDLLQLSRVESRAHAAPSTPLDLGPLVQHMVEIMAPLVRERSVSLQVDVGPGPLDVPGDRDELLRVVENLVENAVKYGGGAPVEVSVRRLQQEGWIELAVRDRGPGIAPEHLPRLTERFYRVEVAESRAQGGTGLGLAIVKHIVGHHRGRLLIESELGLGTHVRVRLPTASPADPDSVMQPSSSRHRSALPEG